MQNTGEIVSTAQDKWMVRYVIDRPKGIEVFSDEKVLSPEMVSLVRSRHGEFVEVRLRTSGPSTYDGSPRYVKLDFTEDFFIREEGPDKISVYANFKLTDWHETGQLS